MEETLKLILEKVSKIDAIEQGLKELQRGQENIKDEIQSFKTQVNTRFDKLEKKVDVINNMVGDLVESRGETEGILKNIK
jgi:hypothetical protein